MGYYMIDYYVDITIRNLFPFFIKINIKMSYLIKTIEYKANGLPRQREIMTVQSFHETMDRLKKNKEITDIKVKNGIRRPITNY
jgi:hypothetical protein